jgi:hypothetical protein
MIIVEVILYRTFGLFKINNSKGEELKTKWTRKPNNLDSSIVLFLQIKKKREQEEEEQREKHYLSPSFYFMVLEEMKKICDNG